MADIRDLNFKVILDDKAFNKQIENDLKAAEKLNTRLSTILNLKKKLNSETTSQIVNYEKVKQEVEKTKQEVAKTVAEQAKSALQQQKVRAEAEKTAAAQRNNTGAVRGTNAQLATSTSLMRTLSQLTGVTFGIAGVRRFLSSLIEITGQFEVQRMALRNMLRDIDGADKIFEDLYRFSSDSTYRFSELAKYAKQLAAFNINQNNLLETTKMLGDVASGVGVSMDRLILAYGHVKSSGFLRGIQLRSFSQNGVPILEELSKMFTEIEGKAVSLGDVFDKMTKREIPFEMVEEAFRRMTGEGGKFYNMQEVLAKTLSGQINILKGRWENLLAAIGQANSGVLKNAVQSLSNIVSSTENFGRAVKTAIAVLGIYEATMITASIATGSLSVATTGFAGVLSRAYGLIAKNPYALLAASIAGLAAIIMTARKEVSDSQKILDALTKSVNNFDAAQANEIRELDALIGRLKSAREGTEEYKAAKLALENRFNPYIQQLKNEGVAVSNLTELYNGLAKKIAEANKQRFLETAQKDIADAYTNALNNVREQANTVIEDLGRDLGRALTGTEEGAIRHYIETGEKNGIFQSLRGELEKERYRTVKYVTSSSGTAPAFPQTVKDSSYMEKLRDLFNKQDLATLRYTEAMVKAAEKFDAANNAIAGSSENATKELTGWRKKVSDAISKMDSKTLQETGLAAKDDEDYYEYLDRIGKKFKELNEEKDKALKVDKPQYAGWLNAIKSVDIALEGNILSDVRYGKTPWKKTDSSSGKSEEQKQIENDIKLLEKFKDAYDKLLPLVGEKNISSVLKSIFDPTGENGYSFNDLEGQITALANKLATFGEDAARSAERIKVAIGTDAVGLLIKDAKAAEKARKELDKYLDTLEKWTAKDKALEGTGVEFKVNKAIADYRAAVAEAEKKYKDVTSMPGSHKAGNIQALLNMGRDQNAALAKLKNNVVGMADDIFKAALEKGGHDLTNWNDKTLGQILAIKKAVESIEIPEEIRNAILKLDGGKDILSSLEDALKKLKDGTIDNTINPESLKKAGKLAKYLAGQFMNITESLREIGDASGNSDLVHFADVVGAISQNLNAAAAGYQATGHWIGAVAGGLFGIVNQVLSLIAEAEKQERAIINAASEAKRELESTRFNEAIDGNSIFGDDTLKTVRAAVVEYRRLADVLKKISSQSMFRTWTEDSEEDNLWSGIFANQKSFGDSVVRVGGNWWSGDKNKSIKELADTWGLNVLDENGVVNKLLIDRLLALDTLRDAERNTLLDMKQDIEEYEKSLELVKGAVESIVGDIASTAADRIVEGWIEAGDAALDYVDILDDVARAYAKMLVQDVILGSVFNDEREKELLDAFGDGSNTARFMEMIAEDMAKIENLAPAISNVLEPLDPYFSRGASDTNSVGSGIKGITEDTASLLASYINAIRADVSVMRGLQERGFADISVLSGVVPTLNDYMNQTAAYQYDIAQSSRQILQELQSVISGRGSDSAMVINIQS